MKQHCEKTARVERVTKGTVTSYWVRCDCGFEGSHRMTEADAVAAFEKLVELAQ